MKTLLSPGQLADYLVEHPKKWKNSFGPITGIDKIKHPGARCCLGHYNDACEIGRPVTAAYFHTVNLGADHWLFQKPVDGNGTSVQGILTALNDDNETFEPVIAYLRELQAEMDKEHAASFCS